jgi:hypothetical protein
VRRVLDAYGEKAIVGGMFVRGIKARHFLLFIPLTIIPLTNFLQNA